MSPCPRLLKPLPHPAAACCLAALAAALATAAALPALAATTSPDAELIALCDEFNVLERHFLASFDRIPDDDTRDLANGPIHEAQAELVERMSELTATTIEGFSALAGAIALWAPDVLDRWDEGDLSERMIAMIVRDLGAGEA